MFISCSLIQIHSTHLLSFEFPSLQSCEFLRNFVRYICICIFKNSLQIAVHAYFFPWKYFLISAGLWLREFVTQDLIQKWLRLEVSSHVWALGQGLHQILSLRSQKVCSELIQNLKSTLLQQADILLKSARLNEKRAHVFRCSWTPNERSRNI